LGIHSFFKIGSNSSVTKVFPWKVLLLINALKCFIFDMESSSKIKWIRFEIFVRGFASKIIIDSKLPWFGIIIERFKFFIEKLWWLVEGYPLKSLQWVEFECYFIELFEIERNLDRSFFERIFDK